ncbi:MAG TPA: ribonuclease P protein component [Candidatus Nanoarchaeia archaeon]
MKWDRRAPDIQVSNNLFKVVAKKNLQEEGPKIGFIITTKVGKSFTRNRLKRKLSELIRPKLTTLKPGIEAIWILHPGIERAKDEEISLEVDKALSKLPSQNFLK